LELETRNSLRLPDGRRLGVAEYGDPDGAPVFHFHGMPGSRLQFHPDAALARGRGVRVLALDRPGLGLSDPQPKRRLIDWPRDVEAAADALGIERFGVIGLSGGGPYAAACAALIPHRLTTVTLVSPLGPVDTRGRLRTMAPLPRVYLSLAARAPALLPLVSYPFLVLARFPALVRFGRPFAGISASDRRELRALPHIQEMFRRDFVEATRQGIGGVLDDARVAARPWGFALESIRLPVTLWYGGRDAMTPPLMERRLARAIPICRVKLIENAGHFLFFHYLKDILIDARGN
jgi:pimeloyl-ACP methyl ester carboxylesterase